MARFKYLVASILLVATCANAGFAEVSPPANWTQSAGKFFYKAAANDTFIAKNTVLTNASLNVGGRSVVMPAAMRFAANAPSIAARSAFGNPWIFGAVVVGSALAEYYSSKDLEVQNGIWMKKMGSLDLTVNMVKIGGCGPYTAGAPWNSGEAAFAAHLAAATSCNGWASITLSGSFNDNNDGTFTAPARLVINGVPGTHATSVNVWGTKVVNTRWDPITETQYDDLLKNYPVPEGLPQLLPVPLPVEIPIINPTGVPSPKRKPNPGKNDPPLPETVPKSQPLRVPQGEPQLVPDSDPRRWEQPSIDIVPSPTPDTPWRVDVQPKKIETPDGKPLPPVSVPNTNKPFLPDGSPNPDYDPAQQPDPNEKPTPEEQKDLCEKNPDILACQKIDLDTPDSEDLETLDKPISITPDSGWGGGGSCPAPRHLTGANIDIPFTQYCDFMTGLKPIVLALAWLSAAFILIGARQSGNS